MRYTLATLASHSALQILLGARKEGFSTLVFSLKSRVSFYRRFPFIEKIISFPSYLDFYQKEKSFVGQKIIFIPHGSVTAYLGSDYPKKMVLPHFGSKKALAWEIDRKKQRKWLEKAGLKLPKTFSNPEEISSPAIVKFFGAKGGEGYFFVRNKEDFFRQIKGKKEKYLLQEYVVGVPVYFHYFYSPLERKVELLGIDRRYESNVDGLARMPGIFSQNFSPSWTVIGNFPLVIRESLLPKIFEMGERVVQASQKLFPPKGLYGPFCLETIVTERQEFFVIEISSRIVAGTNLYLTGSPYSAFFYDEPMSMGRRIAREIREAIRKNSLEKILD